MRLSLPWATGLVAVLLNAAACQRQVAVTTPTDTITGTTGQPSTPVPTSKNTVTPVPAAEQPAFDTAPRPKWLEDKIQQHLQAQKANPPIHIYSYRYEGQKVYFETAPCCDQFTNLYDAKGNLLCHPDGGITGRGDGKCPDFGKSRTEERLVWQDPR